MFTTGERFNMLYFRTFPVATHLNSFLWLEKMSYKVWNKQKIQRKANEGDSVQFSLAIFTLPIATIFV